MNVGDFQLGPCPKCMSQFMMWGIHELADGRKAIRCHCCGHESVAHEVIEAAEAWNKAAFARIKDAMLAHAGRQMQAAASKLVTPGR